MNTLVARCQRLNDESKMTRTFLTLMSRAIPMQISNAACTLLMLTMSHQDPCLLKLKFFELVLLA